MPALTWPMRDARKSMIALPMPVASSTQPSNTKIGTDTSTMLDMPSSIRFTITSVGMVVPKPRKHNVPMPKQNAIGTPATRHTPTKPMRKIGMLILPAFTSAGESHQHRPPISATMIAESTRSRSVEVANAWRSTNRNISPTPVLMAATR